MKVYQKRLSLRKVVFNFNLLSLTASQLGIIFFLLDLSALSLSFFFLTFSRRKKEKATKSSIHVSPRLNLATFFSAQRPQTVVARVGNNNAANGPSSRRGSLNDQVRFLLASLPLSRVRTHTTPCATVLHGARSKIIAVLARYVNGPPSTSERLLSPPFSFHDVSRPSCLLPSPQQSRKLNGIIYLEERSCRSIGLFFPYLLLLVFEFFF